jgi:phage repressor protein C with HTH and peptisase S24 domain
MIYPSVIYQLRDPKPIVRWLSTKMQQVSQNTLAKEIGVSVPVISNLMSGNDKVKGCSLEVFAKEMGMTIEELFRSTGAEPYMGRKKSAKPKPEEKEDNIRIPIYSAKAAAGNGIYNGHKEVDFYIHLDRGLLKRLANNIEDLEGLHVEGDSMNPTLLNGDLVIIDPVDKNYRDGIYLISVNGDTAIKRLLFTPKTIRVISDNPNYGTFEVDRREYNSEFDIIAKVVFRFERL